MISTQDRCFAILEAAAVKRERCPTGPELRVLGVSGANTGILAKAGRIRVEVYGKNWRVIEIMEGPHKGARTMECPDGSKPYRIVYKGKTEFPQRVNGKAPCRRQEARERRAAAQRALVAAKPREAGPSAASLEAQARAEARQSIGLAAIDVAADYELRHEAARRGVDVGTVVQEIFRMGAEVYRDDHKDEGCAL